MTGGGGGRCPGPPGRAHRLLRHAADEQVYRFLRPGRNVDALSASTPRITLVVVFIFCFLVLFGVNVISPNVGAMTDEIQAVAVRVGGFNTPHASTVRHSSAVGKGLAIMPQKPHRFAPSALAARLPEVSMIFELRG